jgi:hypothetical protein
MPIPASLWESGLGASMSKLSVIEGLHTIGADGGSNIVERPSQSSVILRSSDEAALCSAVSTKETDYQARVIYSDSGSKVGARHVDYRDRAVCID